jgi:co-chaperonin GroES (HSP10)
LTKTEAAPLSFADKFPKLAAESAPAKDLDMMIAPDPVGHFMLVALPEVELRTAGGVYIPETVSDRERTASVVGTVIDMGPDCYTDPEPKLPQAMATGAAITIVTARPRFPSGPWCKKGDTVLFSRYAGKRFTIEGTEFRMLADDEVIATIPEGAKVGGL